MLTTPQLKPQGAHSSGRCGGMLPEALGAAGSSPPSLYRLGGQLSNAWMAPMPLRRCGGRLNEISAHLKSLGQKLSTMTSFCSYPNQI